jgi:UDP-glucose:(heptosyl)LPS alpha-1,3-glucosyltransferase
MKIALGMRDFSPEKGGAERSMAELMEFFATSGHEVHIFSHRFGKVSNSFFLHRVPVIPFPKSLRALSFAWRCHHMLKKEDFDVVIGVGNTFQADLLQPRGGVHWSWFWKSLQAYENPLIWLAKFLGRVLSPKQWAHGIIEDAPYKKALKVVAISEMVKRDIVDHYRIPDKRIDVVYTGIDTRFKPRMRKLREEVKRQYAISPDDFVILFSAHNFRLKGLKYLIQAVAQVKREKKQVKLLVLGRDKKNLYERLAHKLGCKEEVIFAGGVKDTEKYYSAADILVHPTFYDSFARVVLEALASGLPVITTRYAGAGWIISEGEEGFVLEDPRDVEDLAEKILYFVDPMRLQKASTAARRLAQQYSRKRCYQEMLKILQEIGTCHRRYKNSLKDRNA